MAAVTRKGLYGGARMPYGSFSGKTEQEIVTSPYVLGMPQTANTLANSNT